MDLIACSHSRTKQEQITLIRAGNKYIIQYENPKVSGKVFESYVFEIAKSVFSELAKNIRGVKWKLN